MKEVSEIQPLNFLNGRIKEKTHCNIQSNESFMFEPLGNLFFKPAGSLI